MALIAGLVCGIIRLCGIGRVNLLEIIKIELRRCALARVSEFS